MDTQRCQNHGPVRLLVPLLEFNRNPHNVDSFSRPRHYSWHGQALAILWPAKWPGGLMLNASADGLRPGFLILTIYGSHENAQAAAKVKQPPGDHL